MDERADLVIIGGGLAGLSLAMRLARGGYPGRVQILEPRTAYTDDRSWAFWTPVASVLPAPASRRWTRWQFATQDGAHVDCSAEGWHYAYVRALDFYGAALDAIASRPDFNLVPGTVVGAIESRDGALCISTGSGNVTARWVVDTRPPEPARFSGSTLFQCFAGREILFDRPRLDDRRVELMTDMRADALGLVFTYVLPLSPKRALVEATRFSTRALGPLQLSADLDGLLSRRGWTRAQVLRSEGAALPMGLPEPGTRPLPGVVRAGQGGGALRAASGFGFVRVQAWAERCARALLHGQAPVGHPPEPWLRGWMDRVFLHALTRYPQRSPEFFLRLAQAVPGDALVRFMSDQGSWRDHARVVAALPPAPFLQSLQGAVLGSGRSA